MSALQASACRLCGLPVTRTGTSQAEKADFCCPGCAVVYSVLYGQNAGATAEGQDSEGHAIYTRTILLVRLGVAIFLAFNVMVLSMALYGDQVYGSTHGFLPEAIRNFFRWMIMFLSLPAIWLLGELQFRAMRESGSRLDRSYHLLILVSVLAAFSISMGAVITGAGEIYFDTCVMLLVLVSLGRLLEGYARSKAYQKLESLLNADQHQWELNREGEQHTLPLKELKAGDQLRLKIGERVPIDGVLLDRETEVSSECRDGELLPRHVTTGDTLQAGELNLGSPISMRLQSDGADGSFWESYCRMAREALTRGSRMERLSYKVASILLPLTIIVALAAFAGALTSGAGATSAIMRGLSVLVVACPCAMGIASPVALRLAFSSVARHGVVPRSGDFFERLASIDHFAIDYTGTISESTPEIVNSYASPGAEGKSQTDEFNNNFKPSNEEAKTLKLLAEASNHPAAAGMLEWLNRYNPGSQNAEKTNKIKFNYHPGSGISLQLQPDADWYYLGSKTLLTHTGSKIPAGIPQKTALHFSKGNRWIASFELAMPVQPQAVRTLWSLIYSKRKVTILTGSVHTPEIPPKLVERLAGIKTGQTPEDKINFIAERKQKGERVAMIGDGLNDLPALQAADLGMAITGTGETPLTATDASLPQGGISILGWLFDLSRRTRIAVALNFGWVIGYNSIAMTAAALGKLHPLLAAILMITSSCMIILSSVLIIGNGNFQDTQSRSSQEATHQKTPIEKELEALAAAA